MNTSTNAELATSIITDVARSGRVLGLHDLQLSDTSIMVEIEQRSYGIDLALGDLTRQIGNNLRSALGLAIVPRSSRLIAFSVQQG